MRSHSIRLLWPLGLALLLLMCPVTASAQEPAPSPELVAAFDLDSHETFEQEVTLRDGSVATLGVQKVSDLDASGAMPAWGSSHKNATGQWKIYFGAPFLYR